MQNTRERDLDDLRQTILEFIADLGNVFTLKTEKGDLTLVEFFYKRLHKERIMQDTIKNLLPHKDHIKKRNISFFDQNRYIFAGLPDDRVVYYGNLITGQKRLTQKDIQMVWEYLDTIIALAESYKKCQ